MEKGLSEKHCVLHLQPKEKVQDAWKPSHVLKSGSLLHFALKAVLEHINGTWNGIRLHDHLLNWFCFPFSVGHAVRKWPFVLSRWTPESRLSCLENQVCWWDNMRLIVVITETRHYSVFLPKGGAFTVHCLVCLGLMRLGNPFSSCLTSFYCQWNDEFSAPSGFPIMVWLAQTSLTPHRTHCKMDKGGGKFRDTCAKTSYSHLSVLKGSWIINVVSGVLFLFELFWTF